MIVLNSAIVVLGVVRTVNDVPSSRSTDISMAADVSVNACARKRVCGMVHTHTHTRTCSPSIVVVVGASVVVIEDSGVENIRAG